MPAAAPEAADFSCLTGAGHAALAVSGGSDSLALMRLACGWAASHQPGLRLSVLTVDHRLRNGSAAEAAQVAQWAAACGLAHQILVWAAEPKPKTGIQARARAARYGLMASWCRAHGADLLLTGHTLDDQAETVAMRLTRTESPDSLAGIRPEGDWQGLRLSRPLLGLRRAALRAYLDRIGQHWIDDPSNEDSRFERVRVRRALAVAEQAGDAPERLAGLASANAARARDLAAAAGQWLRRWLDERDAGYCLMPAEAFRALPEDLRQRVLARIIGHYGGEASAPEAGELRRFANWAAGGAGPPRRTLGGIVAGRRKHGFWIAREPGRVPADAVSVPESGEVLWDRRFLIKAAPGSTVTPAGARRPALGPDVPVFAREAYPWVEQPAGSPGMAQIGFLPLISC